MRKSFERKHDLDRYTHENGGNRAVHKSFLQNGEGSRNDRFGCRFKGTKKTLENADVSVCRLFRLFFEQVQQIKLNKQVKNANPGIEAGDLDIMPQKRTCERRGRIGFSAKE